MNFRQSLLASCLGLTLAWSASVSAAKVHLQVGMTGFQEVNASGQVDQGDPDGFGIADLHIDTVALTVDWNFTKVANIDLPLTGAHIHQNIAGKNGPVVVDFNGQLSGTGFGYADLANVIAHPENFYVNLHNTAFPGGAIRGQLGGPVPAPIPMAVWLFGSGLLGLIGIARRRSKAAPVAL